MNTPKIKHLGGLALLGASVSLGAANAATVNGQEYVHLVSPDTTLSALLATAGREKVLFDTDIGGDPDDGLALVYLLKEPRCDLLGVTTVGGCPELAARIASALCRSLGRADVPVHAGCSLPILRGKNLVCGSDRQSHAYARQRQWEKELERWPHAAVTNDRSAVAFLRRTIRANPGEVTLCATGPFSNVAALFAIDPEIPSQLKRLVLMGGDFRPKTDEWNAFVDVFATAAVLEGGSSPRARGTRGRAVSARCTRRFIPASAGNTLL